jgi:hypothetical protein
MPAKHEIGASSLSQGWALAVQTIIVGTNHAGSSRLPAVTKVAPGNVSLR